MQICTRWYNLNPKDAGTLWQTLIQTEHYEILFNLHSIEISIKTCSHWYTLFITLTTASQLLCYRGCTWKPWAEYRLHDFHLTPTAQQTAYHLCTDSIFTQSQLAYENQIKMHLFRFSLLNMHDKLLAMHDQWVWQTMSKPLSSLVHLLCSSAGVTCFLLGR